MRVSSKNITLTLLRNLQLNSGQINKLSEQISTGKKVLVPSDDPIASTRLVQLQREQSAITQYQSNITRLSGSLSAQESHVTAASDLLSSMYDKMLAASNGTHSEADMKGYGQELESMLDTLIATLNARNGDGSYLFAGTKNDQAPVVYDPETQTYTFNGNTNSRESTVGNGISVKESTDLSHVFSSSGSDLEILNQLKALSEKMQDPAIPQSDYQSDFREILEGLNQSIDKNAATLAGLGGRQNQLTLLNDAHDGVKFANDDVVRELSAADTAEAYVNLQLYMQAIQASNASYMKISQLSLFTLI